MKLSDRHPMQWVNRPVFKLEMDIHGHEMHIRGKVMNYCPSSARYLLMYEDGSSEGVPVEEIEDHVPMLLQLPLKRRRSISKHQQPVVQSEESAEYQKPSKRFKVSVSKSKSVVADRQTVVSRFIQTTLCDLTAVLDVSDDKRQTLLATLESSMGQPFAALAHYDQEGGLDAMGQTLRACANCGDNTHGKATAKQNSLKIESLRDQGSGSRRAAETPPSSPCYRSPCGQHLRELLQGNSVFSPKATRLKAQHAPRKRKPHARNPQCDPKKTPTGRRVTDATNLLPEKTPVVVDLTGDGSDEDEEEDEEMGATSSTRRRLHFGVDSTVHFDERDSVDVFRCQLKRTGHKLGSPPKQNREVWKSVLKVCTEH